MLYRLWQLVTAVLQRLPLRVCYALAFVIGSAGYYLWPRARRAMHENYSRVLRGAPESEIRRTARRSLVNYCKYLADFVRFPALSAAEIDAAMSGDSDFRALDEALAHKRGAVVVCMHFGNWDMGAAAVAARGYPVTVVAETFPDRRLDAMVVDSRTRLGMVIIKLEKAGPSLLRTLKGNGLLALLIDRPRPGDGVAVNFFGEAVEVPAGPARLALRSGAMVVSAAFARVTPNALSVQALTDFDVRVEREGGEAHDVQSLTQAIMDSHERFIRQYPDQWYMFREMWPRRRTRANEGQA